MKSTTIIRIKKTLMESHPNARKVELGKDGFWNVFESDEHCESETSYKFYKGRLHYIGNITVEI